MYYSLLEQNVDGSWWYNRVTFRDRGRAYHYLEERLKNSGCQRQTILEHEDCLPAEILWTYDKRNFYNIAGEMIFTLKDYGNGTE